MKLTPIKSNMTELVIDGKVILFSYQTPVAYRHITNGDYHVTNKKWSKTTSRHINQWVTTDNVLYVDQLELDNLVK